jgi:hypothetical protein
MEPRPNKPSRAPAGSPPEQSFPPSNNPIYSGGDSASWSTSAWTSPPGPGRAEPAPRTEPLTARAADWHGQPGAYAPGSDQGYSPGPSLAPIDQRRGSSWIGPLIAVVVLALIVVAVAIAFNKVRGGNDNNNGKPPSVAQLAGPARTSTAQAVAAAAQTQTSPTAPAATATTQQPTKAATAKPKATDTPPSEASSSDSSTSVAKAKTLLPTVDEAGANFVRTEYDDRNQSAVAASFGDPNDATAKLKEWGWKENVYTTFEIPADQITDQNETIYISVSIHRFATADGASSAFGYFADAVAASGLTEGTMDAMGDQSRKLTGSNSGGNLVVLYIQNGSYLIKVSASSPSGDPSADAIAMAKKIVK